MLEKTCDEAITATRDTEIKARIRTSVATQMRTFEFFFGLSLVAYRLSLILKHTDNLSRTLQHVAMSAAEGEEVAAMTVPTLNSITVTSNLTSFGPWS